MKKIINGKKYDTETATVVAEWSNGRNYGDLYRCYETLYRKQTGEFFLYGEGGAFSEYSRRTGSNEWSSGSEIIPLSEGDASEWLAEHADGDKYEEIFGAVEE